MTTFPRIRDYRVVDVAKDAGTRTVNAVIVIVGVTAALVFTAVLYREHYGLTPESVTRPILASLFAIVLACAAVAAWVQHNGGLLLRRPDRRRGFDVLPKDKK